jgi:hypothetical protein
MSVKLAKLNISNFCLALSLWCDKKEVKRRVYADLLQVLRLLKISDIDKLLNRLFTLQSWCKKQLSFSKIHFVKILM